MFRSKKVAIGLALSLLVALSTITVVLAGSPACDTRVNNTFKKLLECVTLEGVREHQAALQEIADNNGGNRTSGLPGHDASVDYVVDRMTEAGYNVTTQEFPYDLFQEFATPILDQIAPNSVSYPAYDVAGFATMEYSGSGDVTKLVVPTNDIVIPPGATANTSSSGCELADFPGEVSDNIALIQRGTCSFAQKTLNAVAAGAVGVIIFNEGQPGRTDAFIGTLGGTVSDTLPVVGAAFSVGEELYNLSQQSGGVTVRLFTDTITTPEITYNVFAESKDGDPNNVIMAGGHLDSVIAGPGINDNGSGSAALLEVAEQMAKVKPRNMVRFAWWGAEEAGLVGSNFYVNGLTQEEFDRITLYLNFDMVGSPNHVFFIYDGDNSDGVGAGPGPAGSAQIEKVFERYFNSVNKPFKGTDFDGRSDYGPFIANSIPSGGLFTGAEGIKTDEEADLWGGTAGDAYDPCYHQACDTYDNNNDEALDTNSDAIAYATLQFAMNTEDINGQKGKGNFKPDYWGPDLIR